MLRNARNENDIAKQEQQTLLIKHPKPPRIKSSLTSQSMPNASLLMWEAKPTISHSLPSTNFPARARNTSRAPVSEFPPSFLAILSLDSSRRAHTLVTRSATSDAAAEYSVKRCTPSRSESIVGSSELIIVDRRLLSDSSEVSLVADDDVGWVELIIGRKARWDSDKSDSFIGSVVGRGDTVDVERSDFQAFASASRLGYVSLLSYLVKCLHLPFYLFFKVLELFLVSYIAWIWLLWQRWGGLVRLDHCE